MEKEGRWEVNRIQMFKGTIMDGIPINLIDWSKGRSIIYYYIILIFGESEQKGPTGNPLQVHWCWWYFHKTLRPDVMEIKLLFYLNVNIGLFQWGGSQILNSSFVSYQFATGLEVSERVWLSFRHKLFSWGQFFLRASRTSHNIFHCWHAG